ncbi:ABC transporter ATP-binding protein [Candidatus Woesearchaeota archaeon CG10_big_fil_rev_8_21_14_0_10_37_12]|nr:MAG: ABC transporter ATP-binding protein [Candidatus Woesearchaeota archaeon CG10_big_fil_rev_8_21_14_0_10_37_12]
MAKKKSVKDTSKFLQLRSVESGYGKLQILFGVDMDINPSDITLIIGPNGAGKSTILKSMFNLCDVYKGKVMYKGKDITKLPTHDRIKMGIAIVPQGRQVFSGLTVKENLEMGAFMTKEKELINTRMDEVLGHFPVLRKKLYDNAYSLSGGQQQMLAMGRGLMQDPQLLLLDEPSLGLAPKTMQEVFEKVKEIRDEGTAILMVEQNAKAACEFADKIYVLEEGRVAMHGGREILKSDKIKKIYLGGHEK